MRKDARHIALLVLAAVVLAVLNGFVVQKERVLRTGTRVLLELAPRDPRSLIQGDYMALQYRLPEVLDAEALPATGLMVVALDANDVGTIQRLHEDEPLAENEHLLRYRRRGGVVRIGAEAFFFQEGHAAHYEPAEYGELRLAAGGEAVLVGLRDAAFQPLGPPEE